jgi:hypothetical protein
MSQRRVDENAHQIAFHSFRPHENPADLREFKKQLHEAFEEHSSCFVQDGVLEIDLSRVLQT